MGLLNIYISHTSHLWGMPFSRFPKLWGMPPWGVQKVLRKGSSLYFCQSHMPPVLQQLTPLLSLLILSHPVFQRPLLLPLPLISLTSNCHWFSCPQWELAAGDGEGSSSSKGNSDNWSLGSPLLCYSEV